MKRYLYALVMSLTITSIAYAGATFSRIKTWASGETLTAADLNAEFDNILNNLDPSGVDDYSATVTQMRSTANPFPGSVESQATSLAGELERLRYQVLQLKKTMQAADNTYWYEGFPSAGVFTVSNSNMVGINNTSPAYTFDVTGNAHVTSKVLVDGINSAGNTHELMVYSGSTVTLAGTNTALVISSHTTINANETINGNLTLTGTITASSAFTHVAVRKASGDGTQSLTGSYTLVTFPTETYDTLSEFSGSTFTAISTGYYKVAYCLYVSGDTNNSALDVAVKKNGTLLKRQRTIYPASGGFNWSQCADYTLSLTAGDTIAIHALYGGTTGTVTADGASDFVTSLMIDREF